MADVTDFEALSVTALQDLYDAERALVERLGGIAAETTDAELRMVLDDDVAASAQRAQSLEEICRSSNEKPEAAPNIWLRAILDDADRDIETIKSGPLLGIALVGAVRKAKQAQRVSVETALALAARLKRPAAESILVQMHDDAASMDGTLAAILKRLCSTLA